MNISCFIDDPVNADKCVSQIHARLLFNYVIKSRWAILFLHWPTGSNSESVKKKSKRKYSCESLITETAKICTTLIAIIARQVADYFRLICMEHREILNMLRTVIDIIN